MLGYGVLDDRAFGDAARGAVLGETNAKQDGQTRADSHAPHLIYRHGRHSESSAPYAWRAQKPVPIRSSPQVLVQRMDRRSASRVERDHDLLTNESADLTRCGHEHKPRSIGYSDIRRPLWRHLYPPPESVGWPVEERLAYAAGHFSSHRPHFGRAQLGEPLGVVGANTETPQHDAPLLACAADLSAEAKGSKRSGAHSVKPDRATMPHLLLEGRATGLNDEALSRRTFEPGVHDRFPLGTEGHEVAGA